MVLLLFLAGGLVLGEETVGGSAGQSAWENTGGGGGVVVVTVLHLGELLGASDTGTGSTGLDTWAQLPASTGRIAGAAGLAGAPGRHGPHSSGDSMACLQFLK